MARSPYPASAPTVLESFVRSGRPLPAAMVARRRPHLNVGPSPLRSMVGIWQPDGARPCLILPLDVTLYVLDENGVERYRLPGPGHFSDAGYLRTDHGGAVVEAADGRRLGHISDYDHPSVLPGSLRPYVTADPLPELASVPVYHRCLPPEQFTHSVPVVLRTDPPLEGTMACPVRTESYFTVAAPCEVEATRIRIPGPVPDARLKIGAAAVLKTAPDVLVGIVVDYQAAGVNTDALCYPAFRF